jgi:hypothetical protein
MKPIENLYDLVGQSNFTTIGYTFQDEKLKDEFISKLPFIRYKEIDSSFSFDGSIKQKLRDIRLNSILNDTEDIGPNFEYLVLDFEEDLQYLGEGDKLEISRSIQLSSILEKLRGQSIECGIKVIFTTPTYTSFDLNQNLKGGSKSMYMADLAFIVNDGIAKVMKNRFGIDNETFSLNEL